MLGEAPSAVSLTDADAGWIAPGPTHPMRLPCGLAGLTDGLIAAVGAGQEAGVAAHGCAHLLAAPGRWVGAKHERQEPAGFIQPRPDAVRLTGRVQPSGITYGHPADRDPGARRHHAADMN